MDMGPYVDCPGDEFFLISKHILATPQEQLEAIERTIVAAQQLGVPPTNKKLQALSRAVVDLRREVGEPKAIKDEDAEQPESVAVKQPDAIKPELAEEPPTIKNEEVKEEVDETLELLLAAGGEIDEVVAAKDEDT